MASDLSPQSEQYLDEIVTRGFYPTKQAALDAAVAALREKNAQAPMIPEEHMAAVEQAIESANAGLSRPMTSEDWEALRQRARDIATRVARERE